MIGLVILSILIISSYMIAICVKTKGIPYSISATYYAIEHKMAFSWCMTLTAMFIFPAIWDMSTTFTMKLLAVLACVGMLGVGLAPDFKDSWINKVHCVSAGSTLVASQLWVGCTDVWWLLVPIWTIFIVYVVFKMFKNVSNNIWDDFISAKPMFWCEIAALVTKFGSVLILSFLFL